MKKGGNSKDLKEELENLRVSQIYLISERKH